MAKCDTDCWLWLSCYYSIYVMCLQVFLKGDSTDACTAYPLGIMLIYYLQVVILSSVLFLTTAANTFLQVIQAIDTIRRQPKQTVTDLDSPECISTLHTL